jgi:hypothetical protein
MHVENYFSSICCCIFVQPKLLLETYMKFPGVKWICRVVIASMLTLQFSMVQAGMIGAEEMLPAATVQADRNLVTAALTRTEVATQLQAMGVDSALAQERVAAMTDNEVHALAGNVDTAPAGAIWHGVWWILAIALAAVIYFNWKKTR